MNNQLIIFRINFILTLAGLSLTASAQQDSSVPPQLNFVPYIETYRNDSFVFDMTVLPVSYIKINMIDLNYDSENNLNGDLNDVGSNWDDIKRKKLAIFDSF